MMKEDAARKAADTEALPGQRAAPVAHDEANSGGSRRSLVRRWSRLGAQHAPPALRFHSRCSSQRTLEDGCQAGRHQRVSSNYTASRPLIVIPCRAGSPDWGRRIEHRCAGER
jgi:hypothetical protein